jgi:hypothetical protein
MSFANGYTVFIRSAKNWEEFGSARKMVVEENLTLSDARKMREEGNRDRTPAQVLAGFKCEFTAGTVR